ncbi:uncharacterized protein LOC121371801 [Gigantopelta aegis]|uniref:uncharacterized protein LOC121371801 n=1 Tax=Gigantopelta aegis TaxID=1735272 RepID=UPI001B88A263|nr:uncharacterized protein LOC121371801 [Gigantopelta aegis]XP_041353891.1 uncharacterized protein LOC121371801 [Gigantopelta aegis]
MERRRRFTQQRSIGEAFSNFVGNGASRFRKLVTRMNRQRQYGSISNIPGQSPGVSEEHVTSTTCEPRSNHQQAVQEAKIHEDKARAVCAQNEAVLRLLMKRERVRRLSLQSSTPDCQPSESGRMTRERIRCTPLPSGRNQTRLEPGALPGEYGRLSANPESRDSSGSKEHSHHASRALMPSVGGVHGSRQMARGLIKASGYTHDHRHSASSGLECQSLSTNTTCTGNSNGGSKDLVNRPGGSKDLVRGVIHDCDAIYSDGHHKSQGSHDTILINIDNNDVHPSEAGMSHECNDVTDVGEHLPASVTTERKHTGRAFGRYIGKQAGRFRALVLKLNVRNRRRSSDDSSDSTLGSSAKEDSSLKYKIQPNESVDRTSFHSINDMETVSDSCKYPSDMVPCGGASGGCGGDSSGDCCGAVSSHESQSLARDSISKKSIFEPRTNIENMCSSKEVVKKKLQRSRKERIGNLSYKHVHTNEIKYSNCSQEPRTAVVGNKNWNVVSSDEIIQNRHSVRQWSSQSNISFVEQEQRNNVLESVAHPEEATVISKKRYLPLASDIYSHTVDVTSMSSQITGRVEADANIKTKPAKKPFYKRISVDRLATFVTKRSGHFQKLTTKSNSNDCVLTVFQSPHANEDTDNQTPTLATKTISLHDSCTASSTDRCIPDALDFLKMDTEVGDSSRSSSGKTDQTSLVNHQGKMGLDSSDNKYIYDHTVMATTKEECGSQGSNVFVLDKKREKEESKENSSWIKLDIKKSDMLHVAESTPTLLDIGQDVSEKKVLGKTQSCSPRFLRASHIERQDFSQVLTFLSLSSIITASNERLLCKLGVDSLIDISSVAFESPQQRRVCYPCVCRKHNHFRSRLNINIEDIEWENIEEHFIDINKFIEGARLSGKSVLVYSYHGNSRAAAVVIQYLMRHFRMSVSSAYSLVISRRPSVCLNPGFQKALKRLETKLFSEWKETAPCETDIENYMLKPAVKQAWTGCLD